MTFWLIVLTLLLSKAVGAEDRLPIIDMHLHAWPAPDRPQGLCAPGIGYPAAEAGRPWKETFESEFENPSCDDPIWSPTTDNDLMSRTLAIMKRRNVIGVTSGSLLEQWYEAAPERIVPSLYFQLGPKAPTVDTVRSWFENRRYAMLGEVAIQYQGVGPSDPAFEPYLALAEELDVPVGIHVGSGPAGAPYRRPSAARYRGRLSSPLLLEEALIRHPGLRVSIMHAGWPMLDDLLNVLWTHPQVYVDVAAINVFLPRAAFHRYLERIVEVGFGNRILFGSDQIIWPEALEVAIESIETANFLTEQQKWDILYNNAARFLRLTEEEIRRHHGM